jgi:SAM-dependent methyltransferase
MYSHLDQEDGSAPRLGIREIKEQIRRCATLHYTSPRFDELQRQEALLHHHYDILHRALLPTGAGLPHRLKGLFKNILAIFFGWLWRRQVTFNSCVAESASATLRLIACADANVQELTCAVVALQREVDSLRACLARSEQTIAMLNAALMVKRWRNQPHEDASKSVASGGQGNPIAAIDSFLLENRMRGPREELLQRQRIYLDYFRDAGKVLDVGCGRGEFVELLEAEGVGVWGVDADPDMAEFCRELGLPVLQADGVDYLAELEDDSLGGVFLARVVEHLSTERANGLFQHCWSKLRSGGVFVVETINPDCPCALASFHENPGRVRPVPAELLRFLLESQGFKVQMAMYSAPVNDDAPPCIRFRDGVVGEPALYHDYALVGRK